MRSLLAVPATNPRFLAKGGVGRGRGLHRPRGRRGARSQDGRKCRGDGGDQRARLGRAAALGFGGKMCIHPSQVEIANDEFSPSARQVEWAREVLEALAGAGSQGRGAARTKDGRMIDLVHIRIARSLIERAERNATRRNP